MFTQRRPHVRKRAGQAATFRRAQEAPAARAVEACWRATAASAHAHSQGVGQHRRIGECLFGAQQIGVHHRTRLLFLSLQTLTLPSSSKRSASRSISSRRGTSQAPDTPRFVSSGAKLPACVRADTRPRRARDSGRWPCATGAALLRYLWLPARPSLACNFYAGDVSLCDGRLRRRSRQPACCRGRKTLSSRPRTARSRRRQAQRRASCFMPNYIRIHAILLCIGVTDFPDGWQRLHKSHTTVASTRKSVGRITTLPKVTQLRRYPMLRRIETERRAR